MPFRDTPEVHSRPAGELQQSVIEVIRESDDDIILQQMLPSYFKLLGCRVFSQAALSGDLLDLPIEEVLRVPPHNRSCRNGCCLQCS